MSVPLPLHTHDSPSRSAEKIMNGKTGDHPITDILSHKIDVYGEEGSLLFRKVAELSSRNELYEWWEKNISWEIRNDEALPIIRKRFEELMVRAKEGGWETP